MSSRPKNNLSCHIAVITKPRAVSPPPYPKAFEPLLLAAIFLLHLAPTNIGSPSHTHKHTRAMLQQRIAGLGRRPLSSPRPHIVTSRCTFAASRRTLSTAAAPSSSRLLRTHLAARQPRPSTLQTRSASRRSAFQPLAPPSPSSLGAPQAARTYTRSRRLFRRLFLLSATAGALYALDSYLYAAGVTRSARTFGTGLLVALDYKLNFRPDPWVGDSVTDKMFARMFDDAPQNSWADVERVVREDFGGRSVEDVFGVSFAPGAAQGSGSGKGIMERRARASASVAQVHWARLADGREVAIKIQKREIASQIAWDLWAFKTVSWIYSKWFDLPLYSLVPFITERLELETDFENEARNSETMRKLVESEKRLRGRVYVPVVYPELSSRRVMTTEWIEGVRLWDKEGITGTWRGGYGKGSPGVNGAQLPPPTQKDLARRQLRGQGYNEQLKPERLEWKGPRGKGGLGVSTKDVMTTMIDLFSAQIFKWGVVHCDPHPGNIFIRRKPNGRAELVLIDHGLYVYMDPKFRQQYGQFWKALLTFDNATISRVTEDWGIKAADIFASATLLRPYEGGDQRTRSGLMKGLEGATPAERHYEMQRRMKQGVREILGDGDKLPKELMFIGRNMRIVQGNNQHLGSPVNRIKMMGEWASRSMFEDKRLPLGQRFNNAWRHVLFKMVMATTDVAFYFFKLRQWLGRGGGMEDEMEKRMKDIAQDMGIELQHEVFDG
ncbi:ABC transporter [Verticillium dahliae VdLs.17]|uniref:ABC transporter n=1 Tax=Verticillium dahliae (strain VdLs.17 / ATCC MYA-4575 / FGSC 10137) TaxID=498257 RepID=G2WY66_VERDV|nr:ABC transporter [Verticillium dahliae VdLs.17]EGY21024.1 ABC transporter [Verticillium dahliae VdLs.17]